MCGSSLHGTKPNSKDGIGSGSGPAFDRCASSDGVYLLASERTYDIWNAARSTQTQVDALFEAHFLVARLRT